MLAGALEEAMSGCKTRATDFSIAAIMSRGSAHPLRGPTAQAHIQDLLREKAQALQQGKIFFTFHYNCKLYVSFILNILNNNLI